jgi:hypothetical protein
MNDHREDSLEQRIQAHRRGEPGAAVRLAAALRASVAAEASVLLRDDRAARAQLIDETLPAALDYLARDADFAGDPLRLAATLARNRGHDLLRWRRRPPLVDPDALSDWLADPRRSILDEVEPERRVALLRPALGRLSAECRALLRALHVEQLSFESARLRLALPTVSSLLYRRAVCLRRVKAYLAERLHGASAGDDAGEAATAAAGYACLDPSLGGELWRLDDPATDPVRRRRLSVHLGFCASCRQQRAVETVVEEALRSGELRLGGGPGRHVRRLRVAAGIGGAALALGLATVFFLPPGASLTGRILGLAGLVTLVVSGILLRRRRSLASALDSAV